jgi:hypothetical protein
MDGKADADDDYIDQATNFSNVIKVSDCREYK